MRPIQGFLCLSSNEIQVYCIFMRLSFLRIGRTAVTMAAVALAACTADAVTAQETKENRPALRLALQWLPQSQFAGYYLARDLGYYEDAGIPVTLLHSGPGPSSLDFLAEGKADFATLFLADAIVNADRPVALVNVAQFVRRSNLMLVAWKDMGIESPTDLDGRRVSYWPGVFSAAFKAFFKQHGIEPEESPQHHSINLFLNRGVAACAAMSYNEYHRIYQAGVDAERLTVFKMHEYGLGFPEDGLYTTVENAERLAEECAALRKATLKGWTYAREHPEEAIDAVLRESRRAGVPANRPHSRWMLQQILDTIFLPESPELVGRLEPAMYRKAVQMLTAAGMIGSAPEFSRFAPFEAEGP